MTSLVSGRVEFPLQSDLTRKVRKRSLSVTTLRIIIPFFFFFFLYILHDICRVFVEQTAFLMMMMLETRFNSARLRCKLLRKNFRGATSTSLVATDNVTEKMRAIIGDARPCSNSSSISFLLLCIMKERDRRGKRFRLRNLSKWLELLLGIKTKRTLFQRIRICD